MTTTMAEKKVLVLSDNGGLTRAIELNLTSHLPVQVTKLEMGSWTQSCDYADTDFDLMVVALSSPRNEPIVALAKASLAGQMGRVPLLIISERPFRPDPSGRIAHLNFPFDVRGLYCKVQEILQDARNQGSEGSDPRRA